MMTEFILGWTIHLNVQNLVALTWINNHNKYIINGYYVKYVVTTFTLRKAHSTLKVDFDWLWIFAKLHRKQNNFAIPPFNHP